MKKVHLSRTLVAMVAALMVSFGAIVSGTVAWFTSEVESTDNIIASGTLKVGMKWADAADAAETAWKDASTGAIFNHDKWEPGYTAVKYIRILNEGTLAFKYQLELMRNSLPEAGKADLADVIDVYYYEYQDGDTWTATRELTGMTYVGTVSDLIKNTNAATTHGVMLPDQKESKVAIALKMQESAGNEYQGLSVGNGFSLKLRATQFTAEDDSFDDQYDAAAEYPFEVKSAEDLSKALQNVKPGDTITLLPAEYGAMTLPSEMTNVTIKGDKGAEITQLKIPEGAKYEDVTFSGFTLDAKAGDGIVIPSGVDISITLDDVQINGSNKKSGRGLSIKSSDNTDISIVIENANFKGVGYPIYCWSSKNVSLEVRNCEFEDAYSWIVMAYGSPRMMCFENNKVHNVDGLLKALSGMEAGSTFIFANNTMTGAIYRTDRNGEVAFELDASKSTTVRIDGNTLDGKEWIPGPAYGLKLPVTVTP